MGFGQDCLLQRHNVLRNITRDAHVNHPIHHVEADKHDGEDDSAVLVNITAPHPKYSVRRLGWRKCWKRQLHLLGMTVPDMMMVSGQSVVTTAGDGAGHHAARVELQLGLE